MKYLTHEMTRMLSGIKQDLRHQPKLPRWAHWEEEGNGHTLTLSRGKLMFSLTTAARGWKDCHLYVRPGKGKPVDVTEHDGPWVQYATTEIHLMRHELDESTRAKQEKLLAEELRELERARSCFE